MRAPSSQRSARWLWREAPTWVCLLPALGLAPFLGKAFHIDDVQFLIYARLIRENPLNPYLQVFEWDAMRVAIIDFPHPLFWQYLIAGTTALAGESEIALHLLTFAFAVLALVALRGLALRLQLPPLLACGLLAASSGFLVLGSTVMADVAAMALSLAALDRLAEAVEAERPGSAVGSGILAGLAFLTRFNTSLVIVLLLVYPLLRRARSPSAYLPVAVALGIVLASEVASFLLAGRPHFASSVLAWSNTPTVLELTRFGMNELVFLGAQLPITGLALLALGTHDRAAWISLALSLAFAGALVALVGAAGGLALVWFAWAGSLLVLAAVRRLAQGADAVWSAPEPAEALRLVLCLLLVASTFATIRYEHVAVKYLLLPLPAAILLVLDGLERVRERRPRLATTFVVVSLVVGAATGLGAAVSDFRWAGSYRAVFDDDRLTRAAPAGRRFHNVQWGLRYYAERAGYEGYRGEHLGPDDSLLVSTKVPPNWDVPEHPRVLRARIDLETPGPFALLDRELGAGFFSNAWGDLPFVPARRVTDTVYLLGPARR